MYRLAEDKDLPYIYNGLAKLVSRAAKTGQGVAKGSLPKAFSSVLEVVATKKAYLVEGFLVLIEEVAPWYSEEKLLQEWFVMKLYEGGNVTTVPLALLAIARERECVGVITADSSPVNVVGKAYEDAGFKVLTRSYYERIDYGIRKFSC